MFGRVRSSSSVDSLERPPSKVLKDDRLSIYETTLRKLKLGSQLDSIPPKAKDGALEDGETNSFSCSSRTKAMKTEACNSPACFSKGSHELANPTKKDLKTIGSDYSTSTTSTHEASRDCQSTEHSTQQRKMKNSIKYLFSNHKNSQGISTIVEEEMTTTTEDICCMVTSPSSNASQSSDNTKLHSEQESIGSLTISSESSSITNLVA
ncbi:uncharacterized protein LOC111495147 [Cucurbita maxima]|uniref:Uncharacterized protein LOC111495147 n=1 Tax=Cucurbita maxima TaxID=3661 RepID=A0A6J1KL02_CUCMA|nr:uncharacterized protein LOC111495147 [Cucurbita maxima]